MQINKYRDYFDLEFYSWGRSSSGVLLSSGFGLGLALMDVLPQVNYFMDVDNYRNDAVDWEAVGALLNFEAAKAVCLVGWFSIDTPKVFEILKREINRLRIYEYVGGRDNLHQFIGEVK